MSILEATAWRRLIPALAAIGLCVAVLGACGGSDSDSDATAAPSGGGDSASAPSNESDSSRVRLTQCLREQGIDVPDDIAEGGPPPADLDEDALAEALEGPCAKFRADASGDFSDSEQQEYQDDLDAYGQCMRDEGIDFPDIDLDAGPPTALHTLDQTDPDVQAANEQCADQLPQGGAGGH